jgi:2-succinyl-6-hydroxy-2,4-cyclohexadiene-1-carboxylate synthase
VGEDPVVGLHVERLGSGPALALVHGFTQTGRSWAGIADDLATDHEVVLVDAPGHGGSAGIEVNLVDAAGLLAEAVGPAVWVGYSMGARLVLHVAVHHPSAVRGLVLIGGTAGIEDAAERALRRDQDLATAAQIDELGLAQFLDRWLRQPLLASLPREAAGLEDRLRNTVAGLRSSLELAGTGAMAPLWDRLGEIGVPVLAVAGADDERYAASAERIAATVGGPGEVALLAGAGHTAHLEQPAAFVSLLRRWLVDDAV